MAEGIEPGVEPAHWRDLPWGKEEVESQPEGLEEGAIPALWDPITLPVPIQGTPTFQSFSQGRLRQGESNPGLYSLGPSGLGAPSIASLVLRLTPMRHVGTSPTHHNP